MSEELPKLIGELINACNASASPDKFLGLLSTFTAEGCAKGHQGSKLRMEMEASEPELFRFKLDKLEEKKLTILPKYLEMLEYIKQDKKLSKVLAGVAAKAARSESFRSSSSATLDLTSAEDETFSVCSQTQSKLNEVVNKIQARKSGKVETPEAEIFSSPRERRPFLTQDFVFGMECLNPSLSFDDVPPQSQKFHLISDVLWCMLGCSGKYITVNPITEPWELPTFDIPENIDISSKNLLNQILPMAAHHSVIARFLAEVKQLSAGRINQALAAAITLLMTDYKVFVVQMETLLNQQQLQLEKLWYYVYPVLHPVSILSKISQHMGSTKTFGGKTLSVLHDELSMTTSDTQSTEICLYLLKSASVPFFVSLEKWINKGRVFDPFNEFMIIDNIDIESCSFMNKGECYDEYWTTRYMIRKDFVPTFLEKVAEKILRTGKYLNVIRLCKNKKVKEMLPPPIEGLAYEATNKSYLKAIDTAYDFASSALLKLVMEEYDLVNRIKTAKRYFTLEQGDFFVLLMDSSEAELLKPLDDVDPNRLELLLELSVRLCSGAKTDPYKDDICMVLHRCQFYFQLLRIFNIGNEQKEAEFQNMKEQKSQTGLEAFSIGLKVKWPMSLVFNQRVLYFYQMIFRLLLVCKHNERQLCRVWIYDKGVKMLDKQSRQGYQRAFSLRRRMLFFIQNFTFYITEEVIEPNFNVFMEELTQAKDIDCVLQLHLQYLEKSANECMLMNQPLLESIKLIMSKCTEFCDFILSTWSYSMEAELNPLLSSDYDIKPFVHRFEKQPSSSMDANFNINVTSFEETVKKLDSAFNQLLLDFLDLIDGFGKEKQFWKISNVFLRENFNGFYAEELSRLRTSQAD
nr:PREDICTED: gamma-tubulin complex component 2-like isoform X1 [Bemisia tabaci]